MHHLPLPPQEGLKKPEFFPPLGTLWGGGGGSSSLPRTDNFFRFDASGDDSRHQLIFHLINFVAYAIKQRQKEHQNYVGMSKKAKSLIPSRHVHQKTNYNTQAMLTVSRSPCLALHFHFANVNKPCACIKSKHLKK